MASSIRVYELARELGLTNKETLDLCDALGIGVKSHSSSVVEAQADRVRRKAEREGLIRESQPEEPPADKPVSKTAKAKAASKATKATKKAKKPADAEAGEPAAEEAPAKKAPAKKAAAKKAAATTADEEPTPPPPPAPRTYTVVSGDTLFAIAERFYGDGNRYPEIAAASGIANPDLINVGQVITIP